MIVAVGYVFMDAFGVKNIKRKDVDVLDKYLRKTSFIRWHDFWLAVMVVAPAIIIHELGHKVTALSYGLSATFHAAYIWLALAVVLKLIRFPFIFFVPAYVAIAGATSPGTSALIAFAGPGVNLVLFLGSWIMLKTKKRMRVNTAQFLSLTKNINLFLFIFNLIPIPGFDGFTFWSGVVKLLGF